MAFSMIGHDTPSQKTLIQKFLPKCNYFLWRRLLKSLENVGELFQTVLFHCGASPCSNFFSISTNSLVGRRIPGCRGSRIHSSLEQLGQRKSSQRETLQKGHLILFHFFPASGMIVVI